MAMATSSTSDVETTTHLKSLYHSYRHTKNIDAKGLFFSPTCLQICRPIPSYAARDRQTIVRYLHEAAASGINPAPSEAIDADREVPGTKAKGLYSIRALKSDEEAEYGTDAHVAPTGIATAEELAERAKREGWKGMRVDLWNEGNQGLLVKVKYWWRIEDGIWTQCLHDILYFGPKDGTEGSEGEVLE
ncbi:hypothetical protein M501DRAFT_940328 [Patellaria atrata CBS 101060]|uniref:SnoaL-like domain-containing protein n=1 Tax=Patellaria atrata CBS 101060 TaxID=1346257 RepID=A0A9P4S4M6_9PEZI|nr:hypothetical protein M501DRAFT_940328 [Patellaria atrata CBS 101060]